MNNKTLTWVIVGAVVVLGIAFLATRGPKSGNEAENTVANEGRVVFSVTDAAANMGSISEITMTISKVEVHSTESGWVTVSDDLMTFDLLTLNASGQSELLADAQVDEGVYDQVRFTVDSVVVETKTGATKEAKLPSGVLKINTTLLVDAKSTASMNVDFLADKSLHTTGSGEYIFAPVVKSESKSSAEVSINGKAVIITKGNVESDSTVGMDLDGNMKAGFQLGMNQKLKIDANNKIIIDVSGILK